jgi:tetratricopeptide (TPR) repeat protein
VPDETPLSGLPSDSNRAYKQGPSTDEEAMDEEEDGEAQPVGAPKNFGRFPFQDQLICVGIVLGILAIFLQVADFDFVNFDDDVYIVHNPFVQAGVTPASLMWAFTSVVSSNWAPVTMLSHVVCFQLFGMNSGMHHLINVLFHALASLLLFLFLRRATGARWPAAFAAFIFAFHPMHVESVAWVAERKDVLSAFFLFLALYAYVGYTEKPGLRSYLLMLVPFCLGLMSKSMLVTFPFVLLLLDFWPLRRLPARRIVWEKLPLVGISVAVSVATYLLQKSSGAVSRIAPLDSRIANALFSYIIYIRQTFWPLRMAVFYPYPRFILATRAGEALLLLLAVSGLVLVLRRTRPYLMVGWFWYLGMLLPVIGIIEVGEQSRADRYTYLPMVGLSIMVAWGATDLAAKWRFMKWPVAVAGAIACLLCVGVAWKQTTWWQNNETLYLHAIDVTADNWLAQGNLGAYLSHVQGRQLEAIGHLQIALSLKPNYAHAANNLGLNLLATGRCDEAIPYFAEALHYRPQLVEARNNIAICLVQKGRYDEAISQEAIVLSARPAMAAAHFVFATALAELPGRSNEAVSQFREGLRLEPGNAEGHRRFALLLRSLSLGHEALEQFEAAQLIEPDADTAHNIDELRLTVR